MEALKMESQMENRNDDRLDELSPQVGEGFTEVDHRFDRFEAETKEGFTRVDGRFERVEAKMREGFERSATKEEMGEVRGELRRLNERFDHLLHRMMLGSISFGITVLATLSGLVITQA